MTAIEQRYINPAAERANVAKWLALLAPDRAKAVMEAVGATSVKDIPPLRYEGVIQACKDERIIAKALARIAAQEPTTQCIVGLDELVRGVAAQVSMNLEEEHAQTQEENREYKQLCLANAEADREMRVAYRERDAARDALNEAREAYHDAYKEAGNALAAAYNKESWWDSDGSLRPAFSNALEEFLTLGGQVVAVLSDGSKSPVIGYVPKGLALGSKESGTINLIFKTFNIERQPKEPAKLDPDFIESRRDIQNDVLALYLSANQQYEDADAAVKETERNKDETYKARQDFEIERLRLAI
jgi:hypothetical protein